MTTATRRTTLRSASTLVCLGVGSLALLKMCIRDRLSATIGCTSLYQVMPSFLLGLG